LTDVNNIGAASMDVRATLPLPAIAEATGVALEAALVASAWPPRLMTDARTVLAHPERLLGGRLTPWVLFPIAACVAVGGDWRAAIPAAVACELLGAAADLFDDVEDGDPSDDLLRLGPALCTQLAASLLALMARSLAASGLSGARAEQVLWRGLLYAAGGQYRDLTASDDPAALGLEDCLEIARLKSGALAAACMTAGAVRATDDPALHEAVWAFGERLGLYHQLINDARDAHAAAPKADRRRGAPTLALAAAGRAAADGHAPEVGAAVCYAYALAERARADLLIAALAPRCPAPAVAAACLGLLLRHEDGDGAAGGTAT